MILLLVLLSIAGFLLVMFDRDANLVLYLTFTPVELRNGHVEILPMGGQYCGVIGNGCGGTQDCGACDSGMACPTSGASAHICPGSTTTVPPTCTGTTKTTISGTVYDPAGVNPLYNVIVYVPRGPLPSLAQGASCERCGAQIVAPYASSVRATTPIS